MDPVLEIWIENDAYSGTLRLAGRLNLDTRQAVLDAVSEILSIGCRRLVVNTCDLEVIDAEGAGALAQAEHMAREAGVVFDWRGFRPDECVLEDTPSNIFRNS
jgi:anti-anti-sigma regulatory factor